MTLRLNGSTSGYTEIDAPAVAGNNNIKLPTGNGSAHQVLKNSATAGELAFGLSLPSGNGTNGQALTTDGAGGSSWSTLALLGVGQTWTNVTGSRATGTTYTNSTGKPIFVVVSPNASASLIGTFNINGSAVGYVQFTPSGGGGGSPFFYVVPNSATYSVTNNSNYGVAYWWELR